jgi:hypothetical protein
MPADDALIPLPDLPRTARYSRLSVTYQVSRTRCSGRAPVSARSDDVAKRLIDLRDEIVADNRVQLQGVACDGKA